MVSSLADGGVGTLRQAILDSNATPGQNVIRFSIPGPGPYSIAPTSDLPAISNTVLIDGTTQPGFSNLPIIELNGSLDTGPGSTGNGLIINAPGCTVRGLVINRFNAFGITLNNVSGGTIAGNFIGTDPSGAIAEGNRSGGINVNNSTSVTIGGRTAADRNLISGNGFDGIDFFSFGPPSSNVVQGNLIGTDLSGTRAVPNAGNGVLINSSGNQVGGVGPGEANTIAFNGFAGVRVGFSNFQTGVTSNPIRGNTIFGNNALRIDLENSGVTPNGSSGTGTGPNRLQSFPVINSAYSSSSGGTTIEGQLTSTPNSTFTVDFYANDAADPSGFGQGQRFLGASTVTTNPNGVANIALTLAANVAPGQVITATATDRNNNTSEFSHATSVTPTALADLTLSLSDFPDPVLVGSNLTYFVTVFNKGPSRATNTTITDPLPAGATFVSALPSQGTFTASGGVVTANLGDIGPGESETLQIVVQPTAQGTLSNTANVKSDQTDPVPQDDTATVNTTVNPAVPADLAVTSFASQPQVSVGEDLTYSLVVFNNGPSDQAMGVILTDSLPRDATFVSATSSQGTVSVANGTLTADLGSLLRGANATVQIVVRPTSPGRLTNMANVRGAQTDPNVLNNTSTLVTPVIPPTSADLSVSAVALPDPVIVGHPLTYTIQVTNNGPGDTGGVTLTDELDSGVTFVSAGASQGTVTPSGGVITANLGTLLAGQSVLVTIVVQPTAIGTLSNTATVRGDQPDFTPANNRVTITSQIAEEAPAPTILAQRLKVSRQAITDIVLTFSKPMDPVQAEALNNYGLRRSGKSGLPGAPEGHTIPLASAKYDASRRTVTLTPRRPCPWASSISSRLTARGPRG